MKLIKSLTVALLAAASVGTASAAAPTIIHVAGSTAFRTGTSIAIIDTLAGTTPAGGAGSTPVFAAYSDTSVAGAKEQIFANGHIDGTAPAATIIIEATWTGSLAGVVDLVAGTSTAAFIDETNATVQSAVTSGSVNLSTYLGGTNLNSTTLTHSTNQTVEMAMSDSVKTTIQKELANANQTGTIGAFAPSSTGTAAPLATACGGSTVIDAGTSGFAGGAGVVAIVPFEWVLGNTTGATGFTAPTSISQQQARSLLSSGYVPQALFTGGNTTADTTNYFYLEGRNEDSGTRIDSFSESQLGVTASPFQYQVGNDSTTLSPALLYPAGSALNTEPLISWPSAGHSGYASGGNVAAVLKLANTGSVTFSSGKAPSNSGKSFFIGYLGLTDANGAIGAGATALSYNGVPYSAQNVENGSYTLWGYEHCYRLTSHNGDVFGNTIDAIADNIFFNDADVIYNSNGAFHAENSDGSYQSGSAGLFQDGFINVSRSTTEGGVVTHQ